MAKLLIQTQVFENYAWDAEGNLYVQDWNVSGRIMKLVRVK